MIASSRKVPALAVLLVGWACLLNLGSAAEVSAFQQGWHGFSSEDYPACSSRSGTLSRGKFTAMDSVRETVDILKLDGAIEIASDCRARVNIKNLRIAFQNEREFLPVARSMIARPVAVTGQLWLKTDKGYGAEVTLETGDDGACGIVEGGPAADLCAQKTGWYEYGAASPYTFSGTISYETRAGADERAHSIYVLTLDTPIDVKRRQDWGDEWRRVKRMQIGFGGKQFYGNSVEDWDYNEKFSAFMRSLDKKRVEVTGSLRGWQTAFQLLPVLIAIESDNPDSIKVLSK